MFFVTLLRIITFPIRIVFRPFTRLFVRQRGAAAATAKGVGAEAGAAIARTADPSEGQTTLLFRSIGRMELRHKTAAEMTAEEADIELKHGRAFFKEPFELFGSEQFFYEEIEEKFLIETLAVNDGSIDKNFYDNAKLFRTITEGNSRRLLLYIPALFLIAGLILAYFALALGGRLSPDPEDMVMTTVVETTLLAVVVAVSLIVMQIAYRVSYQNQQRHNALTMRAYTSEKFNRMQQNMLRAKERLLTVHLDKRIDQESELREQVATWSGTYLWLSMRMLFCEYILRNTMFRIRRDTFLFHLGGVLLSLALGAGGVICILVAKNVVASMNGSDQAWETATTAAQLGAFVAAMIIGSFYFVLRDPVGVVSRILANNAWTRLHAADVMEMLAEVIMRDKWEIVRTRSQQLFGGGGGGGGPR